METPRSPRRLSQRICCSKRRGLTVTSKGSYSHEEMEWYIRIRGVRRPSSPMMDLPARCRRVSHSQTSIPGFEIDLIELRHDLGERELSCLPRARRAQSCTQSGVIEEALQGSGE